MDSAYFCGANDILKWINESLKVSVTKIESLGAGNLYCQYLESIFPNCIQIKKINFKAKNEYDFQ